VQEVTLPSGFLVDPAGLNGQNGVFSVEQQSDNVLTIYFEKVSATD
jgi:hypothetical protein